MNDDCSSSMEKLRGGYTYEINVAIYVLLGFLRLGTNANECVVSVYRY